MLDLTPLKAEIERGMCLKPIEARASFSVFSVVLRLSSVRIKNKSLTHRPSVGGHGA
jgi:hypothetical protein